MSWLILVRHAAPVVDPSRPSEEWALSEAGRAASLELAARLSSYAPALILSGPEPKQVGTAEAIATSVSAPVVISPGLSEHRRRSTAHAKKEEFESAIRRFFDEPENLVYGEESANQTYERFSLALDGALRKQPDSSVVAVSGGTAISLFISRRSGVEPFPLWKNLRLPTAFVIGRGDWKVQEILYP